jgi:hypothetical protein
VLVAGVAELAQQVVLQRRERRGGGAQRALRLAQEVACGIEREALDPQAMARLHQIAHRVVPVGQQPTAHVVDRLQLPARVVGVFALEAAHARRGRGAGLGLGRGPIALQFQAPGRVIDAVLSQAVALDAGGLPVQRVALEAHQFLAVEHQAVHVARAVAEPLLAGAVRAHRGDALVQFVVFVLPHMARRLAQEVVVLVLAHHVAYRVVEPLQPGEVSVPHRSKSLKLFIDLFQTYCARFF